MAGYWLKTFRWREVSHHKLSVSCFLRSRLMTITTWYFLLHICDFVELIIVKKCIYLTFLFSYQIITRWRNDLNHPKRCKLYCYVAIVKFSTDLWCDFPNFWQTGLRDRQKMTDFWWDRHMYWRKCVRSYEYLTDCVAIVLWFDRNVDAIYEFWRTSM